MSRISAASVAFPSTALLALDGPPASFASRAGVSKRGFAPSSSAMIGELRPFRAAEQPCESSAFKCQRGRQRPDRRPEPRTVGRTPWSRPTRSPSTGRRCGKWTRRRRRPSGCVSVRSTRFINLDTFEAATRQCRQGRYLTGSHAASWSLCPSAQLLECRQAKLPHRKIHTVRQLPSPP